MDITIKNVPYPNIDLNSNLLWLISQGIKISDINIKYNANCYEIFAVKNGDTILLDRFKCTKEELKNPNDWFFKFVRFQIWLDSSHVDFLINNAENNYLLKILELIPKDQKQKSILIKTEHDLFIESDNFQYHTSINDNSFSNLINGYKYSLYSLLFNESDKTYEITYEIKDIKADKGN